MVGLVCIVLKTTILGGQAAGHRRVGEMGIKACTAQFGLNWNWD